MDQQHRGGVQVEGELGNQDVGILVAAVGVMPVRAVGERIGRIDAHAPLDLAGELVDVVDRPVGLVPGGSHAHQREVAAGGRAHDADPVRVQAVLRGLAPDHPDGPLQVLPRRAGVTSKLPGSLRT